MRTPILLLSIAISTALGAAVVRVPPGEDTLAVAVELGGPNDTFILRNGETYKISRTVKLKGNQKITTEAASRTFQDLARVQSFGSGRILDVTLRAQNHHYDFPGDHSESGGRWYWLPVGLPDAAANPTSPAYTGPNAGPDGRTITLRGVSSEVLAGETYLNAWNDDADPADYERIDTWVESGFVAGGNNVIEGVEMRGFRYPFEAAGSHLKLYRCKWIAAKTGVRISSGGLYIDTCWGSGGSQRVHTWADIKRAGHPFRELENQGKRQLLGGAATDDVVVTNSAFYELFDGILGKYPRKLHVINCLFDTPRNDDAIQLNAPYGSVWAYRNIFIGTGPSWNGDNTGGGRFLVEECFIAPGRDVGVRGFVKDRQVISTHSHSNDPHDFHRCTFFNLNSRSIAGVATDKTYGSTGGGDRPHQWHDCLTYRLTREARPSNKLGDGFDRGTTDIRRTVIVDANAKNNPNESFHDGGSFTAWKEKNDPAALYLEAFHLDEAAIMAQPNIGAHLAGRDVGAIPRDAIHPWGMLGPDWLRDGQK
jgi:hypothetical protein